MSFSKFQCLGAELSFKFSFRAAGRKSRTLKICEFRIDEKFDRCREISSSSPSSKDKSLSRHVTRSSEIDFSDRTITRERGTLTVLLSTSRWLPLPARTSVRPVRPVRNAPRVRGNHEIIITKKKESHLGLQPSFVDRIIFKDPASRDGRRSP